LSTYAVAGGLVSFLGWIADAPRLSDWVNNGISIQPNTTIAVMAGGIAVILLTAGFHRAAAGLGALVAFIGGSVLFEYITGIDLGIDTLLMFNRTWGRVGVLAPGRMGPAGATSWTILGTALILATRRKNSEARALAPKLALVTASLSTLSLIGYLYGASSLYTIPNVTVIALQTATFIFAVSIGVVLSVPEHGPMSLLNQDSPAGILARRVVPGLIVGPIVIGFLRLAGERAGLYDAPFGSALRSLCEIGLFLLLLWRTGVAINKHAQERNDADALAQASRSQLEAELTDTKRLQSISQEMIAEENMSALYESILDAAISIMRSDFGSMQMLYPDRGDGGELHLIAFRGFNPRAAKTWECISAHSDTTCSVALIGRKRVIVPDVTTCDYIVGTPQLDNFLDMGIRACQSTPLFSRNGKLVGMISTHWRNVHEPLERDLRLLDILARQAADLIDRRRVNEQALERESAARAEAERAVRIKDDFLATLSHELRTPLNAILGWSQFLKKDITDPQKARYAAEVIERNGRLQAQLVTDLLDMSRILSGKMRLDVQRMDLGAAVEAAVDSILPAAAAKGVRIKVAIEQLADVYGDAGRLQQVVWNLLSNAVKFTPEGGRVEVTLAKSNGHVEIRVNDNGAGIPPEFLPVIFDRFRQADSSASRAHGGLGIGLALVKQLVELHGGKVAASSGGEGKGATFIIQLPFARPSEDRDKPQIRILSRVPSGSNPPLHLKGIKVLVVDDEPDALALVRRILEEHEAEVSTAVSSEEASKMLRGDNFALIVSDIGMPGRDGYALIEEVRSAGLETPAIALTAFARVEDRTKAIRSGYQAHVSKPVEAGELLATVVSLVAPLSIMDRI
jgi:signal transduction histidine kinase